VKVKTVKVEKGRTINLGRYNSVTFRYGMEAEPDDDENYQQVFERVEKQVDEWLDREHAKWK
jgi:hypothetical protein